MAVFLFAMIFGLEPFVGYSQSVKIDAFLDQFNLVQLAFVLRQAVLTILFHLPSLDIHSSYNYLLSSFPTLRFSQDEDAFFRDYAISHKKLSELGFTPSSSSGSKVIAKDSTVLAQSAVGVVVAAAVVILSYFYEVRKRMK